jgi:hypothetical protein
MNEIHDVTFEGHTPTPAELLTAALSSAIGAAKLIERARTGDGADVDNNARCAAMWLHLAADNLDAFAEERRRTREAR